MRDIDAKYKISYKQHGKPMPDAFATEKGLQFMTSGYVVLKDFIPKDVIQMVKSTWKRWESSRKINESIPKQIEYDTGSNSPVDTHNTSESP